MTERGRGEVERSERTLRIGRSALEWDGEGLLVRLDETTTPVPMPLRGTVRLRPQALTSATYAIDGETRHAWRPIAPRAEVEVTLDRPGLSWRGKGYFDTNSGDDPLETSFADWTWSRAHRKRDTLIFYDVEPSAGAGAHLALRIDAQGRVEEVEAPPFQRIAWTFWAMPRRVRGEAADPPRLVRTLEDAPFYTRSQLLGLYGGEPAEIVHESLSGSRLRSPIVKRMLPYRMPRRA